MYTDRFLAGLGYALTAVVLFMAPWLFGAWEQWWFWPFAGGLFLASACFGGRLLLRAPSKSEPDLPPLRSGLPGMLTEWHSCAGVLAALIPFLVYAAVRAAQADVFMGAERSFLLFLTPILVGIQIAFGFTDRQRRWLFGLLAIDLALLGVYGLANHVLTQSRFVLWVEGYDQYVRGHRATGSYFCPDHFSGIMELAFGVAAALMLDRRRGPWWKAAGMFLAVVAVASVILSQSRGGGLTLAILAVAVLVWGFAQYAARARRLRRMILLIAVVVVSVGLWFSGSTYIVRFKSYFGWGEGPRNKVTLMERMKRTSRGRMIGGAIRAWHSSPVWGIGPGMHQNLWPHFAATEDGDRDKGVWPSQVNDDFHSYEVHSDWVQLLEEYGIAGFVLFLVPLMLVVSVYRFGFKRARRVWMDSRPREDGSVGELRGADFGIMLGGFLALVAMTFHSLGDFNLQMPATTWLLAALMTLGLVEAEREA